MSEQLRLDLGGGTGAPRDPHERSDETAPPPDIPGLRYIRGFIPVSDQETVVRQIDGEPWRNDLERRVQHYGWRYDYRARTIERDMHLGPLPAWLRRIAERLRDETGLFDRVPDQAIVNEYDPGQGIAMHVDRQCFGPTIATLSLGDAWRMDLRPVGGAADTRADIRLEEGSALLMTGDARWRWQHGIAKRMTERTDSGSRRRRRRLSLTFRTVLRDGQTLSAG